jgi:cyclase
MFGSQSILVSIDCKRTLWGKQNVFVRAGRTNTGLSPLEHAVNCGRLGAGELIVTSIDREGTYRGYDCELYSSITSNVGMPVIANGGAAGVHDFHSVIVHGGCSAVAAGSMFVYAAQNQGVLINYPPQDELHKELRGLLGDNGDHQFQYV